MMFIEAFLTEEQRLRNRRRRAANFAEWLLEEGHATTDELLTLADAASEGPDDLYYDMIRATAMRVVDEGCARQYDTEEQQLMYHMQFLMGAMYSHLRRCEPCRVGFLERLAAGPDAMERTL